MAGTSQATPEVAGAAALMIAARKKAGLPVLTPNLVKDYLTSTTRGFPQSNGQSYGIGILDTFAAVTKALDPNSSPAQSAIPLVNGVVVRRDVGYNASEIVYKFVVPAKTRVATFRTMGERGCLPGRRQGHGSRHDYRTLQFSTRGEQRVGDDFRARRRNLLHAGYGYRSYDVVLGHGHVGAVRPAARRCQAPTGRSLAGKALSTDRHDSHNRQIRATVGPVCRGRGGGDQCWRELPWSRTTTICARRFSGPAWRATASR